MMDTKDELKPVAWMYEHPEGHKNVTTRDDMRASYAGWLEFPLYTRPQDELIAELVAALRQCNGVGSYNRRGDREVIMTFSSRVAGMRAFDALDQLAAKARAAGKGGA